MDINPGVVAQLDQAGAALRECAVVCAVMAREFIAIGVPPEASAALALELLTTLIFQGPPDDVA